MAPRCGCGYGCVEVPGLNEECSDEHAEYLLMSVDKIKSLVRVFLNLSSQLRHSFCNGFGYICGSVRPTTAIKVHTGLNSDAYPQKIQI